MPVGLSHSTTRAADALRAFAVIAFVPPDGAGSLFAQPPGVFGGGHVAGPPEGGVVVGSQLVDAHDKVDLLMAEDGGGHPVARAVDVDELAGLRQGVDRGQIDRGGGCVCEAVSQPVAAHHGVALEPIEEAQLLEGDGAAVPHRFAVQPAVQVVRGLRRRVEAGHIEAVGLQIFAYLLKTGHKQVSFPA